jgi:hypothetical protein
MEMMNDAVRNFFSNQLSTKFSQMSFLCACAVVRACASARAGECEKEKGVRT